MPWTTYPFTSIQEGATRIGFTYQCWSNSYEAEGLVNVSGHTVADHLYLINHRADVADMIKQEEGFSRMRYCEDQQNGRHTEIALEVNDQGRVTGAVNTHSSLSTAELKRQGEQLLNQEHKYSMDLRARSFGELAQKSKNTPEPGQN